MKEKATIKAKKKKRLKNKGRWEKRRNGKEAAEREVAAYVAIINQLYQ